MRLCSYRDGLGERLGVVSEDRVLSASDLLSAGPRTIGELLAGDDRALGALGGAIDVDRIARYGRPLSEIELLAPVPRPGKIVAIGRNYPEHAAEEGATPPVAPLIFAKLPTSVIGHGDEIRWDPAMTSQVDYEAELAVVIGRRARRVSEAEALGYVLGYTCLNDVSARDLQLGDGQWVRGKSLDTFCPMGPLVVTSDDIPDPGDLAISCTVNGESLQAARTSEMFFSVAAIISHASQAFTLEPGDVIATGTPAGVGIFRRPPRFLTDGDVVTVTVEHIGALTNVCRFERPAAEG